MSSPNSLIMNMRPFVAFIGVGLAITGFAAEPPPTKWTVDGVERVALVFPPSTSTGAKSPVVFAFHGHGGNMHFAARGMAFQNAWPEAIVVYMQGLPTPGRLGDEEALRPGWQRDPA